MSLIQPAATDRAGDLRDLSQAEHLVLFGVRAVALGHGDCPALHRAFSGLLGAEADAALAHLLVFVRLIGAAGGRRIRLHAPGCCGVSGDERLILDVIATAQASLAGEDEGHLDAALGDLLASAPCFAAVMAAQCLAAAFTLSDLHLPAAGWRSATKAEPTLH